MIDKKYIVTLDQGTTSSQAVVMDYDVSIISVSQREFEQTYPKPGWVERDPVEIWAFQNSTLVEALAKVDISSNQIVIIGVVNQHGTMVARECEIDKSIYNVIVWQCRHTAEICEQLKRDRMEKYIRKATGLVVDPYFSGIKVRWVPDHAEGPYERTKRGELLFDTVDIWPTWKMVQGHVHVTDYTNASRTMLLNIYGLNWDDKVFNVLGIPRVMLSEVRKSPEAYGQTDIGGRDRICIPITGITGGQQVTLLGQLYIREGMAKNTYGTDCSVLMDTGGKVVASAHSLLATIVCGSRGEVNYASEGVVLMADASIQQLRGEMRFINDTSDFEHFATKVKDTSGVYVMPAFTGPDVPYQDPYARGVIFSLVRSVNPNYIIRATPESVVYRTHDVPEAMQTDPDIRLHVLCVDGGVVANNFLMQFRFDVLGTRAERPEVREVMALGAAYLTGLAVSLWQDLDELQEKAVIERRSRPGIETTECNYHYSDRKKAVECMLAQEEHNEVQDRGGTSGLWRKHLSRATKSQTA